MAKEDSVIIDRPPFYIVTTWRENIAVFLAGAVTGLMIWVVAFLLKQFIITPVFCRTADSTGICSSGDSITFAIATIAIAIGAVALLARLDVFRPVLVVAATVFVLWNLPSHIGGIHQYAPTFEQIVWTVILYALLFLVFSWIMRMRNFVISLVMAVVLAIGLRLLLVR